MSRILPTLRPKRRTVVWDSFDRADSGTLGTADTGQTWTALVNGLGIIGNRAGATVAINHLNAIETGVSDGDVQVTLAVAQAEMWLNFRLSNSNNRWRCGWDASASLRLQKVVGGVVTNVWNTTRTIQHGDILRVSYADTTIRVFVNGELLGTATDSDLLTNTQVGLQTPNATARFDNFRVEV